jgi:hypothetical protein
LQETFPQVLIGGDTPLSMEPNVVKIGGWVLDFNDFGESAIGAVPIMPNSMVHH